MGKWPGSVMCKVHCGLEEEKLYFVFSTCGLPDDDLKITRLSFSYSGVEGQLRVGQKGTESGRQVFRCNRFFMGRC